jgi:hypothetical protein
MLHISRSRGTYDNSLERATVSRHIPHLILVAAVGELSSVLSQLNPTLCSVSTKSSVMLLPVENYQLLAPRYHWSSDHDADMPQMESTDVLSNA